MTDSISNILFTRLNSSGNDLILSALPVKQQRQVVISALLDIRKAQALSGLILPQITELIEEADQICDAMGISREWDNRE